MEDMIVSLLKVAPKINNDILCKDHTIYMSPQLFFNNMSLTKGQNDGLEGAITKIPYRLIASEHGKNQWKELIPLNSNYDYTTYIDAGIYIFCTYAVIYDDKNYDCKTNTFSAIIPWKYIKGFWNKDKPMEMIIILKTELFLDEFILALKKKKVTGGRGGIDYDLNQHLTNKKYLQTNMCNNGNYDFVFHKNNTEDYITQNEYRFFVQNFDKENHYELELAKKEYDIKRIKLEYRKSVEIIYKGFGIDKNQNIFFEDVSINLVNFEQ